MKNRNCIDIIIISLVAFGVCYWAGLRGFFPLDQSAVFDAGWRIVSGQLPYRDFYAPHGVLLHFYCALIFSLLGTNYQSYVVAAALLNSSAAIIVWLLIRRLEPQAYKLSFWGAVLTSSWFFSIFGTPYPEHLAFLLDLAALMFVIPRGARPPTAVSCFCAGALCFAAFLAKQNIAILMAPLPLFILMLAPARIKNGAFFSLGVVLSLCLCFSALYSLGGLDAYLHYAISIPFELGAGRLQDLLAARVFWFGLAGALVIGALLVSLRHRLTRSAPRPHLVVSAAILLYLVLSSWVVLRVMNNNAPIASVFIGLICALLGILWSADGQPISNRLRTLGVAGALVCFAWGLMVSGGRLVQESVRFSDFSARTELAGLEMLRWGTPTRIADRTVTIEEFRALVLYLQQQTGGIFVFPDFTILYGILSQPAPQPLLWFHRGLTYPKRYDSTLDRSIVDNLKSNNVNTVVLETVSTLGTEERLNDFPILKTFLKESFGEGPRFGIFQLYRRVSSEGR